MNDNVGRGFTMVMTYRMLWTWPVLGALTLMLSGCCSDDHVSDCMAKQSKTSLASVTRFHPGPKPVDVAQVNSSCRDGRINNTETDLDCGGSSCLGCSDGQSCILDSDCASGRCDDMRCGSCSDGLVSGGESDVDCGGPCGDCHDGQACILASDCYSNRCDDGVCRSCYDGLQSGPEQAIDCGGSCARCHSGKAKEKKSALLARQDFR